MFFRLLCEELCSFNFMFDKLIFFVIWILILEGKIFDEWFGWIIICFCIKFSYEYVQSMIESLIEKIFVKELFFIFLEYSSEEVYQVVLNFY